MKRPLRPIDIALHVARETGVDIAEMRGNGKTARIVAARAMFAARCRDAGWSFPKIAAGLGRKHPAGWHWHQNYLRATTPNNKESQ